MYTVASSLTHSSCISVVANHLNHFKETSSSVLASPIGLPCSMTRRFSKTSLVFSMASAKAKTKFDLSGKVNFDHVWNAILAYLTASSTSSFVATGTS